MSTSESNERITISDFNRAKEALEKASLSTKGKDIILIPYRHRAYEQMYKDNYPYCIVILEKKTW